MKLHKITWILVLLLTMSLASANLEDYLYTANFVNDLNTTDTTHSNMTLSLISVDDFEDGDYTTSPTWTYNSGTTTFEVQNSDLINGAQTLKMTVPDGGGTGSLTLSQFDMDDIADGTQFSGYLDYSNAEGGYFGIEGTSGHVRVQRTRVTSFSRLHIITDGTDWTPSNAISGIVQFIITLTPSTNTTNILLYDSGSSLITNQTITHTYDFDKVVVKGVSGDGLGGNLRFDDLSFKPATTEGKYTSNTFLTGDQHTKFRPDFSCVGDCVVNVTAEGELFANVTSGTQYTLSSVPSDGNTSFFYDISLATNTSTLENLSINFTNVVTERGYVNLQAFEKVTGDQILNFSTTSPNTGTTTNGSLTINPKIGNKTIVATSPGFINEVTQDVEINVNETIDVNLTGFYDVNLTINAFDYITNDSINTFSGNITSGSFTESFNSTTGSVVLGLQGSLNYTLALQATNFSTYTETLTLTNDTTQEHNASMQRFNSVNIEFRNEDGLALVDDVTITLDAISTPEANQYMTTNGTLLLELLTPANYTLRYSATGYEERFHYITVLDDSAQNLTLYMINTSTSTEVAVTIVDQTSSKVEGALVKALKYYIDSNSYLLQEVGQTDSTGLTNLELTLNDEFYRFIIEKDGETLKTTNPAIITQNSITIQVVIGEDNTEYYERFTSIDHSLSYNNVTNNFKLTYNDVTGFTSKVCLELYEVKPDRYNQIDNTCATTSAGSLLLNVPGVNGTLYLAKAFYYDGSTQNYLSELGKEFTDRTDLGNIGLIGQFILSTVMVFMTAFSIEVMIISVPVSILIGKLLGLNALATQVIIPLLIGSVIIALMVGRRRS